MTNVVVITPIEPELVARIAAAGATVRVLDAGERRALNGTVQDAAALERLAAALQGAEVVFGVGRLPGDLLTRAPRLRWYQAMTAGVDRVHPALFAAPTFTVTSARGHNAGAVAEHVLWALLALARQGPRLLRSQWDRRWERLTPGELAGRTVGILGFGGIGAEVARRARAFDMRVVATKRSARPGDSDPLLDELLPPDGTERVLAESDAVVVAVPLTPETRHLIDAAALRRMRSSAVLIDVSRGGITDCVALAQALADGVIAGAALDVSEPEPLPADSPLWTMENVIITPHISGSSAAFNERAVAIFLDNLARFRRGEPLRNVVDPERGY
ncbi:MAG: D-2-hydroxyacid dehydrogenase [Dehalococcoidia bacterium]